MVVSNSREKVKLQISSEKVSVDLEYLDLLAEADFFNMEKKKPKDRKNKQKCTIFKNLVFFAVFYTFLKKCVKAETL